MALRVGQLYMDLGINSKSIMSDLSGVGKKCAGVMKGFAVAGVAATAAVTAGVIALGKSVIEVGSSFEATMSEVQAISGATADELKLLSDTAKDFGKTTKFTASEAGSALKFMALAGWDAKQSTEALSGVLNMAAASGMELATASSYVTDNIAAFGMEAKQAGELADMMTYAQSNSNTSAQELGDAWGNCAASMHAAGQDVQTTTAALMILANQGMKGSEAGTAMTAMMRDMTQKMSNGKIMIGQTAIAVQDAQGNFRDLNDIMVDIAAATDGMGSAQKSAALMTTFTARSIKGVNMILNQGVSAMTDYEASLRSASGTAADQAETMIDNLQGDIAIFKSALEGLQIDIYENTSSIARDAVQGATEIIGAFNEAMNTGFSTDKMEQLFTASFDFLGDIGSKVYGFVEKGMNTLTRMLPKLLPKLMNGVKKIALGITKNIPSLIKGFVKSIPDLLGNLSDIIPDVASALFSALSGAIEQVISDLPRLIPALIKGLGNLVNAAVSGVGKMIQGAFNGLSDLMLKAGLRTATLEEAVAASMAKIDKQRVGELEAYVDGISFTVDGEIDVQPVIDEINDAMNTLHEVVTGIAGLDATEARELEAAILSGSGFDVLREVLESMDVPDASGKATEIFNAAVALENAVNSLSLPQEAVQRIYADLQNGGDAGTIAAILMEYDVPQGQAEEYGRKIEEAANELSGACEGLTLPESVLSRILSTLNSGGGAESVQRILEMYNVPPGIAKDVAGTIETEQQIISDALAELNLPQEALDEIWTAVANGATEKEITEILEAYNVENPEEAGKTIAEAGKNINNAIGEVRVADTVLTNLSDGMSADKAALVAALGLLNISYDDYKDMIASWETAGGTISGKMQAVFDGLITALTDGIKDNPNDPENSYAKAIQGVTDYFDSVSAAIDTWKETKIKELEESGLTGDELTAAIENVKTQADAMYEHLGTLEEKVVAWAEAMSGKPSEYVAAHVQELRDLLTEATAIDAEIRAFSSGVGVSQGESHRSAVKQGLVTDQEGVLKAIKYTSLEYEAAISKAAQDFDKATKEAAEQPGISAEEYSKAYNDALAQRNAAVAAATEKYNTELSEIGSGYVQASPELSVQFDKYVDLSEAEKGAAEIVSALQKAYENAVANGETLKLDEQEMFNLAPVNWRAVADELGIEGGAEELASILSYALEVSTKNGKGLKISGDLIKLASAAADNMADDISADDFDMTSLGEVFMAAVDKELIAGVSAGSSEEDINSAFAEYLSSIVSSLSELSVPEGDGSFADFVGGYDLSAYAAGAQEAAAATDSLSSSIISLPPVSYVGFDFEAARASLTDFQSEIETSGEAATQAYANGMADTSAVTNAAENLAKTATKTAERNSSTTTAGNNFSRGMAQGILSGKSNVVNAAIEVAKAAAKAAKETLQISSPSKVTEEFGKYFDYGFVRGIEGNVGVINSAIKNALQLGGPSSASYGSTSVFRQQQNGIDYDRLADAISQRPSNIIVNGKLLARTTSDDTAKAQNARSRTLALGYGK